MRIVPDDERLMGARILAVDDEAANLSLVDRAFRREGFQNVVTFLDPREALQDFAARRPDLVLLDLMMPGVDGYELLEGFRRLTGDADYRPILGSDCRLHHERSTSRPVSRRQRCAAEAL